jgi:hypothetical protein
MRGGSDVSVSVGLGFRLSLALFRYVTLLCVALFFCVVLFYITIHPQQHFLSLLYSIRPNPQSQYSLFRTRSFGIGSRGYVPLTSFGRS